MALGSLLRYEPSLIRPISAVRDESPTYQRARAQDRFSHTFQCGVSEVRGTSQEEQPQIFRIGLAKAAILRSR